MTVQFLPVSPHIGSPVLSRFRIEVVVFRACGLDKHIAYQLEQVRFTVNFERVKVHV